MYIYIYMDHLSSLFSEVLIYVSAFGIMELIIKYFKLNDTKKMFIYIIFLMIGVVYHSQSY